MKLKTLFIFYCNVSECTISGKCPFGWVIVTCAVGKAWNIVMKWNVMNYLQTGTVFLVPCRPIRLGPFLCLKSITLWAAWGGKSETLCRCWIIHILYNMSKFLFLMQLTELQTKLKTTEELKDWSLGLSFVYLNQFSCAFLRPASFNPVRLK